MLGLSIASARCLPNAPNLAKGTCLSRRSADSRIAKCTIRDVRTKRPAKSAPSSTNTSARQSGRSDCGHDHSHDARPLPHHQVKYSERISRIFHCRILIDQLNYQLVNRLISVNYSFRHVGTIRLTLAPHPLEILSHEHGISTPLAPEDSV
jgi:hypothetical protein